jgi:hypothetical protein
MATTAVLPSSRPELDFNRLSIRVHVRHCADIAVFEAFSRFGLGQNDSIALPDHFPTFAPFRHGV